MNNSNPFKFTFEAIEEEYSKLLSLGYKFFTCTEYVQNKQSVLDKVVVNRIDIDVSVKKAERLGKIFSRLGIKGTFFIRLHGNEYNPISFENYRIIKGLIHQGHEIGYHSEIVDQAHIWNEEVKDCLMRDIEIINTAFDIEIQGVASHGGSTGLNNLDFWKNHKASEFNLLYEAYDTEPEFNLFDESFYISDSEWTRWKCYAKGRLVAGDQRSPSQHAKDSHNLIYLLIHSDTYFDRHFYE